MYSQGFFPVKTQQHMVMMPFHETQTESLSPNSIEQLVQKFTTIYRTSRFIAVLTKVVASPCHEPVKSSPHPHTLFYVPSLLQTSLPKPCAYFLCFTGVISPTHLIPIYDPPILNVSHLHSVK
jgi:hypothetical protein